MPDGALLARHDIDGSYTDAFSVEICRVVSFVDYVCAFYTTTFFRLERFVLATLFARPSTDAGLDALARANAGRWAAWVVEARAPQQLLLADVSGRTRSWLMAHETGNGTRLWFGSAIVPSVHEATGTPRIGYGFRALIGAHRCYSVALLEAAASALRRA